MKMKTYLLILLTFASAAGLAAELSEIFGGRNPLIIAILKYEYVEVNPEDSVVAEAIKEAEFYFSLIFSKPIFALPKRYYVHKGSEGSVDALKTEIDSPLGRIIIFQTSDFIFIQVPFLADGTGSSNQSEFVKTAAQALINQGLAVDGVKAAGENLASGSVTLQYPLKVWVGEKSIVLAGIKVAMIPGQRPNKVVLLNDNDSQLTWFKRLASIEEENQRKEEQGKRRAEEEAKRLGPEYDEIQKQIDERNARRKAESERNLQKAVEQLAPIPAP